MPGPLYHVGAVALCPHAGQVTVVPVTPRVLVGGMPVATMGDQYLVAGCTAPTMSGIPPCTMVRWLVPAARVLVNGLPVLLQTSVGACLNPAPQGPPAIVTTQPRVIGT